MKERENVMALLPHCVINLVLSGKVRVKNDWQYV